MTTNNSQQISDKAEHVARDTASSVSSGTKSMREFVTKFFHDWSFHLTQALAFGLVTSVIPLGMLLFAIVGLFIGKLDPHAQQQFITHLKGIFPPQILPADITASSSNKIFQSSGLWIVLSALFALFFGSRLFTLLEACFDIIYHVPPRPQKQKNIRAIVMVIVFMILTPLLVLTSLIPGGLLSILQNSSLNVTSTTANKVVGIISSLVVSFLLFEIIYAFIPNRKRNVQHRLRSSVRGALTAAIVLQIGLIVFPIYTTNYVKGIVGQIAFALIFMIFFYIIALVTIIGAEVNSYFADDIPAPRQDLVTRSSRTS